MLKVMLKLDLESGFLCLVSILEKMLIYLYG